MRHIHPLQPISMIILILVFLYLRKKKQAAAAAKDGPATPRAAVVRPVKPEQPPEVVYANLRRKALEATPEVVGMAGSLQEGEPYGALMEMGISDSVVTLVCFADGEASLYYKSGGGMVGGSSHDRVRKAAKEFTGLAYKALPLMTPAAEHPVPADDKVRFYALTPQGTFTTETDRQALAEPGNPLSALFYGGQEVVSQMRQVQAQRAAG
jgi:hypothetical protein